MRTFQSPSSPPNRHHRGGRLRAQTGDQKSNVANPQSATPASSIDHSDGFNANNLPSLTTYAIIGDTRCCNRLVPHNVATAGGKGCSAQTTHWLNFARLVSTGRKLPIAPTCSLETPQKFTALSCYEPVVQLIARGKHRMHNSDYYREQAAKYRELAEGATDVAAKQEFLELAAACEEAADKIDDRRASG
jgi:hypothetical protein